jgi:hypothetical protein
MSQRKRSLPVELSSETFERQSIRIRKVIKSCDQCEALSINGMFCHETGCPNSRKTWVAEREQWVLFVPCFECGSDVEVGTSCDCQNSDE